MGRFVSVKLLATIIVGCVILDSCGSSKSTNVVTNPVPASVILCVSPSNTCATALNVSVELGKTQVFTATARNILGNVIADTFTFQSTNPTVLTIAANGTACAGTWNSLTNPQVCTPGPVGTAQITAISQGVSSPPVTVYVHQRVTGISVSKAPTQSPTLSNTCLSKGAPAGPESWTFQAFAFNGSSDITPSVGPFAWQDVEPTGTTASVIARPAMPAGAPLNQQLVTANNPGQTLLFASAGGLNSQTIPVETCRVQSVQIAAANTPGTSFVVNTGTSTTLNATVTDTVRQSLLGVPLTWTSSNPVSVGVSGSTSTTFAGTGTVSAPAAGAGTVIASCTPPTCNGGIKPSLPIYPQSAISFVVRSTSQTPANPTAYATTTACRTANPTNATCNTTIVPITRASATASFAAGNPAVLPSSPNSILFDSSGANAYLGVDSSNFGQSGLMVFNGSSASQVTGAPGKVLAVSPDKTLSVISDTADTPNQVFICSNCTATSASARTISPFLIAGATAAAFSPDSLKAYIVAGSNLYVFSKLDALQQKSLGGPAKDVAFFPQGAFGYLAGPSGQVTARRTCDNLIDSGATVSTGATPSVIRALPDGTTMMALEPPFVDLISGSVQSALGCTPSISNSITSFNLGQGSFTPTQFFLSMDGSTAYILGQSLPYVIAFNTGGQTSSLLSLANGALPLSASVSPAGDLLFVGANDGTVHVIDTTTQIDLQQVTFTFPQNTLCYGPGNPVTPVPLTVATITAATQTGSSTTYDYTLPLISGPPLQVGESVVVTNMKNGGNNGTFVITSLGTGTFTVANALGVTATGQSATATVPITCNPDLVAVKP
jgi:hypothetical protein